MACFVSPARRIALSACPLLWRRRLHVRQRCSGGEAPDVGALHILDGLFLQLGRNVDGGDILVDVRKPVHFPEVLALVAM